MECWQVEPLDFHEVHRCRAKFSAWLASHVDKRNPIFEYEIIFGELVTNAVRYGASPVHVEVARDARELSISVEDYGTCFDLTANRGPATFAQGGRGLDIVKHLVTHLAVSNGPNHPCRVEARMALCT
jgi:anti-sigma regulatory factor (Ser/Thr protein kinase)